MQNINQKGGLRAVFAANSEAPDLFSECPAVSVTSIAKAGFTQASMPLARKVRIQPHHQVVF
jgi:hypothetical protein